MSQITQRAAKGLKIKLAHFARSGEVNLNISVVYFQAQVLLLFKKKVNFPFLMWSSYDMMVLPYVVGVS